MRLFQIGSKLHFKPNFILYFAFIICCISNEDSSEADKYQLDFKREHLKCYLCANSINELLDSRYEENIDVPVFNIKINFKQQDTICLNNLYLHQVNPNVFKGMEVKKIELIYNFMYSLNHQVFKGLRSLETLNLNCNNLTELDDDIFEDLSNLSTLNLLRNGLKYLNSNLFHRLINLKELNLRHNFIENVHPQSFRGLEKLKIINLAANKISNLEGGLFEGLKNLQVLELSGNDLKSLKSNLFSGLCNLEAIILNDNQIEDLDCMIFQGLSNLKYINLGYNRLVEIKVGLFDGISSLKYLVLKNNLIREIDSQKVFKDLIAIKKIDVSGNKMSETEYEKLNNQIEKLTKREYLTDDMFNEIDAMYEISGKNKHAAM